MRNVSTKVDNVGDELTAGEFNSDQDELENAVTSTDQSLDSGGGPDNDLNMLGKAMAAYASGGQYYADSGGINNYVLSKSTNLKPVPTYKDGMIAVFKASSANTGASTINVSTLGTKNLTQFDGSALDAAQIVTNDYISVIYNSTNDRFELMGSGVSEFAPGTVMLFGNSTAPIGWTRKSDWQDSAMFCYKSTGTPGSGGAVNPQTVHNHTGPSHTHTMQNHIHSMMSHTHTEPTHRHTGPNHYHSGPNHAHTTGSLALSIAQMPIHNHTLSTDGDHSHTVPAYSAGDPGDIALTYDANLSNRSTSTDGDHTHTVGNKGSGSSHNHGNTGNGGTGSTGYGGTGYTNYSGPINTDGPSVSNTGTPSNNTTAAAGTGNTSNNLAPYYQEVIAATKD